MPTEREAFFDAIGQPELASDARFVAPYYSPDVRHELFDLLSETFRRRSTTEWTKRLREIGVRCAPVRDYLEVMQDEGVWANGYLQRFEHPEQGEIVTMGCPIRLSDTPARPGRVAPEIGQHTEEVLLELGLGWDEIGALRRVRAI